MDHGHRPRLESASGVRASILNTLNNAAPPYLSGEQLAQCWKECFKSRLHASHFVIDQDSLQEIEQGREKLADTVLREKLRQKQAVRAQTHGLTPATNMSTTTQTLDRFLEEISKLLKQRNGIELRAYLQVEPPFQGLYEALISDIRRAFPKGQEDALEDKCSAALPEARDGEDGASWTPFIRFLVQYFSFIRDVNSNNLLDTYNILSELVQKCNSALQHASLGIIVLPTVVTYSRLLAKLAIGLDKQPQLIAHLKPQTSVEGSSRETLPEKAANIVRQAFVTCLNERGAQQAGGKGMRPGGKKIAVYTIANLCLKILFQCGKTRNAEQIFVNIYNQSPPLANYPRSEQATYLYYLGRFLFSTNHFYRAQLVLQEAFRLCHSKCTKQKKLILIYLMTSNIILGRFPSQSLYRRPEAQGLREKFEPICSAIANGDLATFHKLLALDGPNSDWFLHYKILLQLRNRCEIIVWRSLARKAFLIHGDRGDLEKRKAATIGVADIQILAEFLGKQIFTPDAPRKIPSKHTNQIFMDNTAPEPEGYIDSDLEDSEEEPELLVPDILEVESVMTSLIDQGLLTGYLSHRRLRFAIRGAKEKGGALAAGFPNVWQTIKARAGGEEVPGWKKESHGINGINTGGVGGGMVVNLSGARPAGAGP